MKPLTAEEFHAMEQLLADLLATANTAEQTSILLLHARLVKIYDQQADLRSSLDRLTAMGSQTFQ